MLFYFVYYVQMKNLLWVIRPPEAKNPRNLWGLKIAATFLLLVLWAKVYGQWPMRGDTATAIVQTFEGKSPWTEVMEELEEVTFFPDSLLSQSSRTQNNITPDQTDTNRWDTEPVISWTDRFANDINTILSDMWLEDYISIPLASNTLTLETAISVNWWPAAALGTLIEPNSTAVHGKILTPEEGEKIMVGFFLYQNDTRSDEVLAKMTALLSE